MSLNIKIIKTISTATQPKTSSIKWKLTTLSFNDFPLLNRQAAYQFTAMPIIANANIPFASECCG